MSFLKRAYLYTTRKKIRTGLLFSIILIISTLLIVCFSINSSTDIFFVPVISIFHTNLVSIKIKRNTIHANIRKIFLFL